MLIGLLWVCLGAASGSLAYVVCEQGHFPYPQNLVFAALLILAPIAFLLCQSGYGFISSLSRKAQFHRWVCRLIITHAAIATAVTIGGGVYAFGNFPYIKGLPDFVGAAGLINLGFDIFILKLTAPPQQVRSLTAFYIIAVLSIISGGIIGLEAWNYLNVNFMLSRAAQLASGQPYCIQVDSKDGGYSYREAKTRSDLHWRTMRSIAQDYDRPWDFHGLLLVETGNGLEWRNWSYRQRDYMLLSPYTIERMDLRLKVLCEPRLNFSAQIK